MKQLCPCHSLRDYNACCAPYHNGQHAAPTAEILMRSRYSAYSLALGRYLFKTWHKSTRPTLQSLLEYNNDTEWVALKIVKTEQGMRQDDTGIVAFVASYSRQNQLHQMRETSQFERVNGKWVYVNALALSE